MLEVFAITKKILFTLIAIIIEITVFSDSKQEVVDFLIQNE